MAENIPLTTPLLDCDIEKLHAGDTVLLSGPVYTARDMAHLRLFELLDKNLNLWYKE